MLLKRMKTKVFFLLLAGLLMILPVLALAQESHECDFAAVLTRPGHIVADILDNQVHPVYPEANIVYDCPEDFFYSFVTCYSSPSTNDDGYGIIYSKHGETTLEWKGDTCCPQVWHTPFPYYPENQEPMDAAHEQIMIPDNRAVMVMSHARNASPSSGPGNHPFLFDWNKRTYAFMHNGTVSTPIKYAMWYDLYYNTGPYPGYWFDEHPSNWVSNPINWQLFIDSEIFFHWIMKQVINASGSVFAGLHKAITANLYNPGGGEFNLYEEFTTFWESNKINFVLFDGESLFVYRNTIWGTPESYYNVSYRVFERFVGAKTKGTLPDGIRIPQFTLVHITPGGTPLVIPNFPDAQFADLQIFVSDDPDPVEPFETLVYFNQVMNSGNSDAVEVIVSAGLPPEIPEALYSLDGGPWYPWTGSINLGYLSSGYKRELRIAGQVIPDPSNDRPLEYQAKIDTISFDPDYRNNKDTETTTIR